MASTNKTSSGLNMWAASDKPVREDFNNDNRIIDGKIAQLNSDFFVIGGLLYGESLSQTFDFPSSLNLQREPYLLSAQIQLNAGVWTDMRVISQFTYLSNNLWQMMVIKVAPEQYAGYQVRFLFKR